MNDVTQLRADERELNALLVRFCRGVDRSDEELLRSCYHPDAIDDHGTFKGSGWEFAAFLVAAPRDRPITQHALSNVTLEVRGDVAFGESYVQLRTTDESGEPMLGFGRYIDRFERRDGAWKIAYRRVTLEGIAGATGYKPSDFVQATRDRTDPSYER